ncbi:hypothetical protein AX774_g471 [Zancudomyces culisetae]|uniref:Uncharacterized protein n=1 Tax=Zancudomyces culisetae TaxID=1213189 RepID=A0A1R1PYB9_ZANCU|nr:hypothetical protein AX774_g471 [Zancudomyces culisetae]|eukprot:OMH85962.1 hypothetical protein AX774_g471 [Zancudomyces culisetae]
MKKLTLTKVTKFGAYDADEKMHFFLRASPEWDHMSFEELLESGKTLITPLETSLTTNNTYEVEKLEDYFSNTMHSKYFRGTADVDGNVGGEKPLYVSQEIYEVLNKRTNDMGDFNETSSYKVTGESNERLGLIRGSSYHRRAKSLSSMDRFSCFKPSNLLKNPKSYLQSLVLQTKCNILAPGKKKDSV